jgi:hypothetical protein
MLVIPIRENLGAWRMTKHYENMDEYNSDNNTEPQETNSHDYCQRNDCYVGEDNLLEVKLIGSYSESLFICESFYDNNLDWYSLIL